MAAVDLAYGLELILLEYDVFSSLAGSSLMHALRP